jgi:hypothetical protein
MTNQFPRYFSEIQEILSKDTVKRVGLSAFALFLYYSHRRDLTEDQLHYIARGYGYKNGLALSRNYKLAKEYNKRVRYKKSYRSKRWQIRKIKSIIPFLSEEQKIEANADLQKIERTIKL